MAQTHWNYRVVKRTTGDKTTYSIHETYYHGGSDEPHSISVDGVAPLGESVDELAAELAMFERAFDLPVLNHEDF